MDITTPAFTKAEVVAAVIPDSYERLAGQTLTGGVGAHVKGAWVELDASTARRVLSLTVVVISGNTASEPLDVDIGVGAGGSEAVLIGDIPYATPALNSTASFTNIQFAVEIDAGTRIAARCSSTAGAGTETCVIRVWEGNQKV